MSSFTPNRQGLKDLANFNIDAQFVQQLGTQVFNYQGDNTAQYEAMCADFTAVVNDSISDLNDMLQLVPVFKK